MDVINATWNVLFFLLDSLSIILLPFVVNPPSHRQETRYEDMTTKGAAARKNFLTQADADKAFVLVIEGEAKEEDAELILLEEQGGRRGRRGQQRRRRRRQQETPGEMWENGSCMNLQKTCHLPILRTL